MNDDTEIGHTKAPDTVRIFLAPLLGVVLGNTLMRKRSRNVCSHDVFVAYGKRKDKIEDASR